MHLNRSISGLLMVAVFLLQGCIDSGPSQAEQEKALEKLNKNTMSVAVSLKSMLNAEQDFAQRQVVPLNHHRGPDHILPVFKFERLFGESPQK